MGINLKETVGFDVNVVGDRTGEKWFGQFSSLKRLSHRQELLRDKIRRELLGTNQEGVSRRALDQADMLSELQVSLIDTPSWWKEAGNGIDLGDDNILTEVYTKVIEIKLKAIEEIQKKGEEAGTKLKDIAESGVLAKKE